MANPAEVIRSALALFGARDFDSLSRMCHEDFEFVSVFSAVDGGEAVHRGPDAWRAYGARMDELWEDWRTEDLRFLEAGGERVAVLMTLVGAGRHSRIPVRQPVGLTYQLRDGKLWRVRSYSDPSEALRALGLTAPPG